ncbi:MAG: nucleic acid-binding protein [Terriglobia bacterium]|jgi:predicted nucleic acid-binding protein
MKTVFADSLYWIAVVRPNDAWGDAANAARKALGDAFILSTDEVLSEFLAALSHGGETLRRQAAKMVRAILSNPNVRVIPQSRDSFLRGLELYELRGDKEYSLTDCISMNAMKSQSVNEILTNDHHFAQEGFSILIKK